MEIVKRVSRMREVGHDIRERGESIGLVPTMGMLHDGHLSLLRRARSMTDRVVMSLFVNPTQFGPGEDFETYPRDAHRDIELARKEGVDFVFIPESRELYPDGYDTYVSVDELGRKLCGRSRPEFFRGVATIVTKLFALVGPDFAFFGEKDRQQLIIIKRVVRDLNLSVEIVGCPIIREPDGLAMSSRNLYLSAEERTAGTVIKRALDRAREEVAAGERAGERVAASMREVVASEPLAELDYAEVVDLQTLDPVVEIDREVLCAIAAVVGKARLIDNATVAPQPTVK